MPRHSLTGVTSSLFPCSQSAGGDLSVSQCCCHFPDPACSDFCGKFLKFAAGEAAEGGGARWVYSRAAALTHGSSSSLCAGSELRDVCREGAAAVVPGPVWRLPGCVHHQHDHVLQGRPGLLRPHPQTQTRSHVSRAAETNKTGRQTDTQWSLVRFWNLLLNLSLAVCILFTTQTVKGTISPTFMLVNVAMGLRYKISWGL